MTVNNICDSLVGHSKYEKLSISASQARLISKVSELNGMHIHGRIAPLTQKTYVFKCTYRALTVPAVEQPLDSLLHHKRQPPHQHSSKDAFPVQHAQPVVQYKQ